MLGPSEEVREEPSVIAEAPTTESLTGRLHSRPVRRTMSVAPECTMEIPGRGSMGERLVNTP